MMSKNKTGTALDAAVRLLARRNHTRRELEQKLRLRKFSSDEIQKAIARCDELGYINDAETARLYFRELKNRGYGPRRIWQEFKKKGIADRLAAPLFAEDAEKGDEKERARDVLTRRMVRFKREKDPQKRREKMFRFLYSRGFSGDVIREIIQNGDEIE